MTPRRTAHVGAAALFTATLLLAGPAAAEPPVTAHAAEMAKFDFMRGVWAGPASGINPDGSRYAVHQTERIGPMLGGDLMVIEGRGYKADGTPGFNAFGVISYDARTKKYEMRSYAMGQAGTFAITPTRDGYQWFIPAGPATIRYTATVEGGTYREIGERLVPGRKPVRIFEMNLERVGDTDWPLGQPVPASAGR
jgi:hypothetical protein